MTHTSTPSTAADLLGNLAAPQDDSNTWSETQIDDLYAQWQQAWIDLIPHSEYPSFVQFLPDDLTGTVEISNPEGWATGDFVVTVTAGDTGKVSFTGQGFQALNFISGAKWKKDDESSLHYLLVPGENLVKHLHTVNYSITDAYYAYINPFTGGEHSLFPVPFFSNRHNNYSLARAFYSHLQSYTAVDVDNLDFKTAFLFLSDHPLFWNVSSEGVLNLTYDTFQSSLDCDILMTSSGDLVIELTLRLLENTANYLYDEIIAAGDTYELAMIALATEVYMEYTWLAEPVEKEA